MPPGVTPLLTNGVVAPLPIRSNNSAGVRPVWPTQNESKQDRCPRADLVTGMMSPSLKKTHAKLAKRDERARSCYVELPRRQRKSVVSASFNSAIFDP